jgi:hypothetical protein
LLAKRKASERAYASTVELTPRNRNSLDGIMRFLIAWAFEIFHDDDRIGICTDSDAHVDESIPPQ